MGGARSTVQEGPASVLAPRVDESAARQESRSALAQRRPVRAGQGLLGRLAGREAAGDRVLGIVRTPTQYLANTLERTMYMSSS